MAKRFTDTGIWDKPWFRKLSPKLKEFWRYLYERCNFAGVWECDFETASWFINQKVDEHDLATFGDKIVHLPDNKIFIPGFIEFQYGELSDQCKPHKGVLKELQKHGIDPVTLTASIPFDKGIHTVQDKDKDKDKDKEKEKGGVGENKTRAQQFVDAWNENCGELPRVEKLTAKREEKIKARLKDEPDLEYWKKVFQRMAQSPFCLGKTGGTWRADFDFALQPDSHVKTMEGKYDARKIDPDQNVLQIDADKKRQLAEAQAELDAYAKTLRKL